ncbi:MAG: hypothetical protein ACXAD7_19940 [Candidatus Kariarchaeaceae archaeon]|jgi:hypothetical protein
MTNAFMPIYYTSNPIITNIKGQNSSPNSWHQTYGGSGSEMAYALIQTSDGGYVLTGYTDSFGAGNDDVWLVKTDVNGSMQWNKTYGSNGFEMANALIQASDGGFILAGYTDSFGAGNYDVWLVKTDVNGNMQWNKTYGGERNERANALIQASDGGFIFAGYTDSFGAGNDDVWLVKTDVNGNMQWNKTYGGNENDRVYDLVMTSDGGYALVGYTNPLNAINEDIYLVKTDDNGSMQWDTNYGGDGSERASTLVQTIDGGYIIVGHTDSFNVSNDEAYAVKTDVNGSMQWNKTYGGEGDDRMSQIIQSPVGGIIISGFTRSFGAGQLDMSLVWINSNGTMQFNRTYGGEDDDMAFTLIETADEGLALTGSTYSFGAGRFDMWLIKMDYSGHVIITKKFDTSIAAIIYENLGVLLILVVALIVVYLFYRKKKKDRKIRERNMGLYPVNDLS